MPIKTAVVLAAGEGARLRPLTITRPKLMLPVCGVPFIHKMLLEVAESGIKEAIVVVGYKGELVKEYLQRNSRKIGLKLSFVWQEKPLGTGHAYSVAAEQVGDSRFLGLCADNFYPAKDLREFLKRAERDDNYLAGAIEVEDPRNYGVFSVRGEKIVKVTEKPANPETNLSNTSLYIFDRQVLEEAKKLRPSPRGEYEITDTLQLLAGRDKLKFHKLSYWKDLGSPWDLLDFNQKFLSEIKGQKIHSGAEVERGVTIKGPVSIGKGTLIKSGAYIEGPVSIGEDCEIGPNCFIRQNTSLGERTKIGQAVEIKGSIVFGRTNISHLSYVGDSVIGENCNFGAGTVCANLRHDGKSVKMFVKGVFTDTKRRKLGAIVADNSKTGINTSILPGKCIGPGSWTDVASVVERDVPPGFLLKRDGTLAEISGKARNT